jgi:hypothetical protein
MIYDEREEDTEINVSAEDTEEEEESEEAAGGEEFGKDKEDEYE